MPAAGRYLGHLSHHVITPFYRNLETAVSQWLMTCPQLQRWEILESKPSASLPPCLLLVCFTFVVPWLCLPTLCVCCFSVIGWWTVSMALHGKIHSWLITLTQRVVSCFIWPRLSWRVSLGLHLLMFTKKAAWVSVSPGALFSVRKWSDYAFRVFFFFDIY